MLSRRATEKFSPMASVRHFRQKLFFWGKTVSVEDSSSETFRPRQFWGWLERNGCQGKTSLSDFLEAAIVQPASRIFINNK